MGISDGAGVNNIEELDVIITSLNEREGGKEQAGNPY